MNIVPGPSADKFKRIKDFVNSEDLIKQNAEKMKSMNFNRAERKHFEKKNNKLKNTINKLTPSQYELVEEMANTRTDQKIEEFKYILDRSLAALLIEYFPDKTYKEIYAIEQYYSNLVNEDIEKCFKLEESWKRNSEMSTKILAKHENDVLIMCEELVNKGLKQKEAIDELVIKFPMMSKSMVTNAYKKVKTKMDKLKKLEEAIDPDVEEALETIEEIINESENEVMVDKIINGAEEENKKIVCDGNTCSIVEEKVKEIKKPGLKVLSMNVKGDNGTYSVCSEGIELRNNGQLLSFGSEADFDKWVGEFREVFGMLA